MAEGAGRRIRPGIGRSPDARRLAGLLLSDSELAFAVAASISPRTQDVVSTVGAHTAKWLADGRRVACFTNGGWPLVVLDTVTRARTVVDVRLPGPSTNDRYAIKPDNRTICDGPCESPGHGSATRVPNRRKAAT